MAWVWSSGCVMIITTAVIIIVHITCSTVVNACSRLAKRDSEPQSSPRAASSRESSEAMSPSLLQPPRGFDEGDTALW
jgi:hypothetical protein